MQPNPMAETSRLLFPSFRFCIIPVLYTDFCAQSPSVDANSISNAPTMLPRHRPVFIGPSRPDDQLPVCGELVNARKVLADKQVARNRSLHVMRQHMLRFIHFVAPE